MRQGEDIRDVLRTGVRYQERRVVLYVLPTERGTRVAFVCGRRVGTAVARNRARRLMRETWSALAPGTQGGFDIVFVARPEIRGAVMGDVLEESRIALARTGVIVR